VLPGSANHSGLIGRINETEMGVPFLVGSNYAGVADRTGILILGINDTGVDNNAGAFTATIEVEEPASSSPTPSG
jgi:hypothetical protein